jgi:type II secretory pathway component HofQ
MQSNSIDALVLRVETSGRVSLSLQEVRDLEGLSELARLAWSKGWRLWAHGNGVDLITQEHWNKNEAEIIKQIQTLDEARLNA